MFIFSCNLKKKAEDDYHIAETSQEENIDYSKISIKLGLQIHKLIYFNDIQPI